MDLPMSSYHSSSFPGWKTSPGGDYYNWPPSSTHFPKRIESGIGVRPELPLSNCWFGIARVRRRSVYIGARVGSSATLTQSRYVRVPRQNEAARRRTLRVRRTEQPMALRRAAAGRSHCLRVDYSYRIVGSAALRSRRNSVSSRENEARGSCAASFPIDFDV
jgi:hypothetical protein